MSAPIAPSEPTDRDPRASAAGVDPGAPRPRSLLDRVVVPRRLSLLLRDGRTLGYNPQINASQELSPEAAEAVRWLRAGRPRPELAAHLMRRFSLDEDAVALRLRQILQWCLLHRLLYLDREPAPPSQATTGALGTVYWVTTQACNLRCTYCYQDATRARPSELTTDEARDLVEQAVEAGARTFVFTGGEPFVRRDLLELGRHARGLGLRTEVITNGWYITRKTIDAVAEAFERVTISIDHMIPEHHDRLRGEGSWRRAAEAAELVRQAGISFDINSVLSRFGLADLDELLHLEERFGAKKHRVVPQFPLGRADAVRDDEIAPDELLALHDQLHAARRRLRGDDEATETAPPREPGRGNPRRAHCGAGLAEVSVDPEGWVYPCRLLQSPAERAGNVRDQRLAAIYAGHPALARSRERTTTGRLASCATCIIREDCGGGCRGIHASFTLDPERSAPLFCAFLRAGFEVRAWGSTGEVPPAREARFADAAPAAGPIVPATLLVRRPGGAPRGGEAAMARIDERCLACGACLWECPTGAISPGAPRPVINAAACTQCYGFFGESQCAAVCPADAVVVADAPPATLAERFRAIAPDRDPQDTWLWRRIGRVASSAAPDPGAPAPGV